MEKQSRARLGRGLDSLLMVSPPDADESAKAIKSSVVGTPTASDSSPAPDKSEDAIFQLPVGLIHPNPHQPRRVFDADRLRELADSLKSSGLVQPIIVRKHGDGYQLVAGERRLRASKLAGLPTIPAIVRDVNSFEQAQLALVENIQRENLNPVERAQSYNLLISQLGLTQAELAARLGEDRSAIANHLRLLQLPQSAIDFIGSGQLSLGHAKLLAGLEDPDRIGTLAKMVVDQGLSVRNLERIIAASAGQEETSTGNAKPSSPHQAELERSLSRQLGARVEVHTKAKGKGKLVLHYDSLDAFDTLMERLHCKISE